LVCLKKELALKIANNLSILVKNQGTLKSGKESQRVPENRCTIAPIAAVGYGFLDSMFHLPPSRRFSWQVPV
jgi:hypothetical protein